MNLPISGMYFERHVSPQTTMSMPLVLYKFLSQTLHNSFAYEIVVGKGRGRRQFDVSYSFRSERLE